MYGVRTEGKGCERTGRVTRAMKWSGNDGIQGEVMEGEKRRRERVRGGWTSEESSREEGYE